MHISYFESISTYRILYKIAVSKSNFFSKKSEINVCFIDSHNSFSNRLAAFKATVPILPPWVDIENWTRVSMVLRIYSVVDFVIVSSVISSSSSCNSSLATSIKPWTIFSSVITPPITAISSSTIKMSL